MSDIKPTPAAGTDTNILLPAPLSSTTTLVDGTTGPSAVPSTSEAQSNPAALAPIDSSTSNPAGIPDDPDRITEIPFEDPPSDDSIHPSSSPDPDHPIRTVDSTPVNSKATTLDPNETPCNPLVRSWIPDVNRNIFQRIGDRIQRMQNKSIVKDKLQAMLKMRLLDEYLAAERLWQVVAGAEMLDLGDDWVYYELGGLVTLKEQKKQGVDWDAVERRVRLARSAGCDV